MCLKFSFGIIERSCTDVPNFKDIHGTTCEQTEKWGNCKDGRAGKIPENVLLADANADGISPLDACCVCGGGQG